MMKNDKPARVRHRKYGRGYVYIIGEDDFGVAFLLGLKRVSFPISAMRDDTLIMSKEDRAKLQKQYAKLLERAASERQKRR
mgnify:CR=1 FL=1